MSVLARYDRFLGAQVSMRSLAIVRILLGPITLMHLWPFVSEGLRGETYQDYFHHPYVPLLPDLPEPAYVALLLAGGLAAVAMSLGLWTRIATSATFGIVAYNLVLSTTHMHNNRAYLVAVLGLLALAPCGRAFSIDAWWRRRKQPDSPDEKGAAWPLWLLRFECATVYGASGLSKLLDADWRSGLVPWGRLIELESEVRASIPPDGLADLVLNRDFHTFAAKLIIATELFIAGALWWRRSRGLAIVVAVIFHIMIEFTARVQIFSYLGIAVLFVWADPALPWLRWRWGRATENVAPGALAGSPRAD